MKYNGTWRDNRHKRHGLEILNYILLLSEGCFDVERERGMYICTICLSQCGAHFPIKSHFGND